MHTLLLLQSKLSLIWSCTKKQDGSVFSKEQDVWESEIKYVYVTNSSINTSFFRKDRWYTVISLVDKFF